MAFRQERRDIEGADRICTLDTGATASTNDPALETMEANQPGKTPRGKPKSPAMPIPEWTDKSYGSISRH
jgi:hypothetical protein